MVDLMVHRTAVGLVDLMESQWVEYLVVDLVFWMVALLELEKVGVRDVMKGRMMVESSGPH